MKVNKCNTLEKIKTPTVGKKREVKIKKEIVKGVFQSDKLFRCQNELEGIWAELVVSVSEHRHRGNM